MLITFNCSTNKKRPCRVQYDHSNRATVKDWSLRLCYGIRYLILRFEQCDFLLYVRVHGTWERVCCPFQFLYYEWTDAISYRAVHGASERVCCAFQTAHTLLTEVVAAREGHWCSGLFGAELPQTDATRQLLHDVADGNIPKALQKCHAQ